MGPLAVAGIGAGVGLLKNVFVDAPRERRQRRLAATQWETSPWTHVVPGEVQESSMFNNMLQGGLQGASFGQKMEAADAANALKVAQLNQMQPSVQGQMVVPSVDNFTLENMAQNNPQNQNPWSLYGRNNSVGGGSNLGF